MDNTSLSDTSTSHAIFPDTFPALFCFVEKEKAQSIQEQKKRQVYDSQYAVRLPSTPNGTKNGSKQQARKQSNGKARLIPLGLLQFSSNQLLRDSKLEKQDAFRFYIWCGTGKLSQKKVRKHRTLLPSIDSLKKPTVIQVQPNTPRRVYIVDQALGVVDRAARRRLACNYQKGEFETPVAIIGRPLSWDEVYVP